MPPIIFISPHFKSDTAARRTCRILSTTSRPVRASRRWPTPTGSNRPTEKQAQLIHHSSGFSIGKKTVRVRGLPYTPHAENASDFIQTRWSRTLIRSARGKKTIVDYIGTRPGVFPSWITHGLLTALGKKLVILQVQKEIAAHSGVVWTRSFSAAGGCTRHGLRVAGELARHALLLCRRAGEGL
jgi:hypothetical protein